ncbi:MAG: Rid family hydrolase, partial [Saprospiraceae bacterium]
MKKIIYTPDAPSPIGPYSQAVEANGMLFVSGQIALDPVSGELI